MSVLAIEPSLLSEPTRFNIPPRPNSDSQGWRDSFEEDFSAISYKRTPEAANSLIEEEVSVCLERNETDILDAYLKNREPLIAQRNEILDSPIKQCFPWNKKKLRNIDSQLDKLDMKIYELESKKQNKEINTILSEIRSELNKLKSEPI